MAVVNACLGGTSQAHQGMAKVEVCHQVAGIEGEGLAKAGDGLVDLMAT